MARAKPSPSKPKPRRRTDERKAPKPSVVIASVASGAGADGDDDEPSPCGAVERPRVLVTGISGRMGRLLTQRLHRIAEVHGVDRRPFIGCPKDVVMHHLDIRKKRCEDLFRHNRYDAVYHLAVLHDPRRSSEEHHSFNVRGTMKILEYVQRYSVPKVVLLSSAAIYGPHPNNPQFLTEDSPLLAGQRFPQIRDLIELDMLAQSFFWKHAEIETVILRPVHIVGPNMRNAFTNYLRMRRPYKLMGFDPLIQIIHEADAVEALILAMRPGVRGIFNVAGGTAAPLSVIFKELGRKPFSLPHPLAKFIIAKLFEFNLSDFPAPEIDYTRFICIVDGSRAESLLGYHPKYSLRETLASLKEP